jgi:hypothetical protein
MAHRSRLRRVAFLADNQPNIGAARSTQRDPKDEGRSRNKARRSQQIGARNLRRTNNYLYREQRAGERAPGDTEMSTDKNDELERDLEERVRVNQQRLTVVGGR